MKTRPNGIFSRIGLFVFFVIAALGVLFVLVTYTATSEYYQASTQLLNKDVAERIAKLVSPFDKDGIDHLRADSVFNSTMIISPNTEIYFLDTIGKVKYYYAPDSLIKEKKVLLGNIQTYLRDPVHLIKNTDPRDPATPKIFSVRPVMFQGRNIGYIYVILAGKEYRNVAEFVFRSRVGGWATKVFFIIILATVIFSLLYTSRLQRRFNHVINVLDQFKEGKLNVRFHIGPKDEFFPIADAFNKMVAMLDGNFTRLKLLEGERKTFLANISHDLRTPLAVARGYTETLLMESTASRREQESHLELILSKVMQVEKLVLQLFELSKMESVNFTPQREPFVFSEILQESIKGAEFQARQKGITVICENCEDSLMIEADISMMERVIQNLLENAVKYTRKSGTIRIALERQPGKLVLLLENSGRILPLEILAWFNSSAAEEAVERPKKAGLGLALVKRILQLHGYGFEAVTRNEAVNSFKITLNCYQNPAKKVR